MVIAIRPVRPEDVPAVVAMVHELADFEQASEACTLTEAQLRDALFRPGAALFGHVAEVRGNGEAAAGDAAKELQQPPIAGTVNPRRTHDGDADTGSGGRLARNGLAFELRLLIDVARLERRVLARGRILDVAVHADGAAMHDARHARRRRFLDQHADGTRTPLAVTTWGGGGRIWAQQTLTVSDHRTGEDEERTHMFFVGTEDQCECYLEAVGMKPARKVDWPLGAPIGPVPEHCK